MKPMELNNAIRKHFVKLGIGMNEKGYVDKNEGNLIEKFSNWEAIKLELQEGQGSELKKDNDVIKFNAVHSSSALCVNNFAPFKEKKDKFSFFGYSDFIEATFEKKLPTGISTPNLDFYLENKNTVMGFESKFTELLVKKLPNIVTDSKTKVGNLQKYLNRKKELNYLADDFFDFIEEYVKTKDKMHLDVAQLIKHFIGITNKSILKYKFILNRTNVSPVLVYIYWQPANWYNIDIYCQHAREIEDFKARIEPFLIFIPISYLEFWKMYENNNIFGTHIQKVKERYYFVV